MRSFTLTENDGGQRLDKFISKAVRGLPVSLMYKYIRQKRIKVNGKRAEPKLQLAAGDLVEMYVPDEFFEAVTATDELRTAKVRLTVVYEDENILLADKRPGMLSHPGDPDEPSSAEIPERETLLFQIRAYLCQTGEYVPEQEHAFSPALCNRIDRNTGGLVIAAKNAEALREMNEQIRLGNVHKSYLCAVHGKMEKKEDTLRGYLRRDLKRKTVRVYREPVEGGKEIVTVYQALAYNKERDLSLLRVNLLTGRTHQIRAHFASVGHPLLGEGKYGENKNDRALGWAHQALYSYRVTFDTTGFFGYLKGNSFSVNTENIRFLELFPTLPPDKV